MEITIELLPGDMLRAVVVVDELEREAFGWQSALTNHFDADAYGEDGHRLDSAEPRGMTPDEAHDYARRLLIERHPELASELA